MYILSNNYKMNKLEEDNKSLGNTSNSDTQDFIGNKIWCAPEIYW